MKLTTRATGFWDLRKAGSIVVASTIDVTLGADSLATTNSKAGGTTSHTMILFSGTHITYPPIMQKTQKEGPLTNNDFLSQQISKLLGEERP